MRFCWVMSLFVPTMRSGRAFRVANRAADRADPDIFAVRSAVAVILVIGRVVLKMVAKYLQHPATVVGMQTQSPLIIGIFDIEFFCDFFIVEAEQKLITGRAPD